MIKQAQVQVFALFYLLCFALPSEAQLYNIEVYSVRDGLGQSQVFDIYQDQRGILWMGTSGGGLSKFNGKKISTIGRAEGLRDPFVKSINELPNGRLFIGGIEGSCIYNGLEFQIIEELEGKEIEFTIKTDSCLYISTPTSLFCFRDGDSPVELLADINIYGICASKNADLLLLTDEGIQELKGKTLNPLDLLLPCSPALANSLLQEEDGSIWVSTYGHGVYHTNEGRFTKHLVGEKSKVVFKTLSFKNGERWFCTLNHGILIESNGSFRQISMLNGLPSNTVLSCTQDDWGNVWLGTSGGGVAKFSGQDFTHIDQERGLPGKQVYSIGVKGSEVFMGVADRGLVTFSEKNQTYQLDTALIGTKVKSLLIDDQNRIWAGTEGKGVRVISADTSFWLTRSSGLSGNWIRAIEQDSKGSIFLATAGGGITKLVKGASKNSFNTRIFNSGIGLAEDRITDLAIDNLNRVWFSTISKGLGVLLPDGTLLGFDKSHGLTSNSLRSLAIDQMNRLWIGTNNNGICSLDLSSDTLKIVAFDTPYALSSPNIYFLQPSGEGELWVGTEKGIDLLKFTEDRQLISSEYFSENDGYEGIEACTNASAMAADGTAWFGTVEGVSKHSSEQRVKETFPPRLSITNANLFYQSLNDIPQHIFMKDWGNVKDTLVFTYEQNHVSFDFIGVHQQFPDDVEYQWYLEGQDPEWSPLNERTTATFSNLSPADYIFHLRACVKGANCTEAVPVVIRILRPFWQKTWFKSGAIGALATLLFLLFYTRIRAVKRKSKEKSERLRLERDVIDLEQKALRLQMNPHFIFNTLNSIQGLIAKKDEKTARLYLSKFSKLMRMVLENSREDLISLGEEFTALKSFLELEQFTQENAFTFRFESDFEVDDYGIPPLLIQPFVENAIIHGVTPQGFGEIVISARIENDLLIVEVTD
ncbi:MAG: ligand-binding sensor domain-containing protein, partial [Flavobacteriales bacterium]